MHQNRTAFLHMYQLIVKDLAPHNNQAVGYDVIVTGIDGKPETFTDFSTHPFANGRPAKQVRDHQWSTAAGAYQQKLANWLHYAPLLALPDFSPASQDAIALRQIAERGAFALVDAGRIEQAIAKVSPLWTSSASVHNLPINDTTARLLENYQKAGGMLST